MPGSELTASGSRFQGISEASGGNGVQNSSSNYPLVQLLSLANEQTLFLLRGYDGRLVGHLFHFRADHSDDHQFERFPHWLRAGDCLHQRHPQPIAVRTRRNVNAKSHADAHGESYPDCDCNANSNVYADSDANGNGDSDSYGNSYIYTHGYCDLHAYAYRDTDGDGDCNTHRL